MARDIRVALSSVTYIYIYIYVYIYNIYIPRKFRSTVSAAS